MGIFDWLFGKKETTSKTKEDVKMSKEKKTSSSEIIKKLYPKLKGIEFELIATTAKGESPEKFFVSDIDGKWFYTMEFSFRSTHFRECRSYSFNAIALARQKSCTALHIHLCLRSI